MSVTRVQEWLAAVCNAREGVAEGVVVLSGPAEPVIAAHWMRAALNASEHLHRSAQSAMRARQAVVETVQSHAESTPGVSRIVAVPLMRAEAAAGALVLWFSKLSPDDTGAVVDTLRASGAALMSEHDVLRDVPGSAGSTATADGVLQIQAAVLSQSRFDQSAAVFATRLAQWLVFDRVSVGIIDRGYARVAALSHGAALDGQQALTRAIAAAMDCEHMVNLVGPVLALKSESEISAIARARRAGLRQWERLKAPDELPFKLAIAGALLLAVFVLGVPLPYSISAPTRLEGAVQRALVAASDGFIQQTSVRPGDVVKEGQVLAELAQHDLQIERSKRDSELAQHINAYSAAFARADRSLLMVNQAKKAEARAQVELIDKQIERAQIKAPFDGVIISGDLTQSLGAPIQRGAVLMVIAPVEQFRLIVEVDERDINDVKAGAAGRVALAAMPGTLFSFRIERVTPLAATREGRHFFEVEGKLDAASAALRPGLQGVARIDAAARPLAAMAFNRLLNWLRLRLWSWGWWL